MTPRIGFDFISLAASIQGLDTQSLKLGVVAGFDGFVDTIVRVILEKPAGGSPIYFPTKKRFAEYIIEKEGSSFSLEMEEMNVKAGGNMPIMANALGELGFPVQCIGAMGYPGLHPAFGGLSGNCTLHSFAAPGLSTAVEFEDGKMILGQMGQLHTTGWEQLKSRLGLQNLREVYSGVDLICFLNWSEIEASSEIWAGVLEEILPSCAPGKRPIAFFDLADCSKKSSESINNLLEMLAKFSRYADVTLGLNLNGAKIIFNIGNDSPGTETLEKMAEQIFKKLSVQTLLLHSSVEAVAVDASRCVGVPAFFIQKPLLSTGAGDNFNAGFCAGLLLKKDLETSLIFGHAVASLYMQAGKSPTLGELADYFTTRGRDATLEAT
jgi:sugar/nucleoside kinase (ribokinase family)